jgi:hypothetical protein
VKIFWLSVKLLKCSGLLFRLFSSLRIGVQLCFIMLYSIFIIKDMAKLIENVSKIEDDGDYNETWGGESCAPELRLLAHDKQATRLLP